LPLRAPFVDLAPLEGLAGRLLTSRGVLTTDAARCGSKRYMSDCWPMRNRFETKKYSVTPPGRLKEIKPENNGIILVIIWACGLAAAAELLRESLAGVLGAASPDDVDLRRATPRASCTMSG